MSRRAARRVTAETASNSERTCTGVPATLVKAWPSTSAGPIKVSSPPAALTRPSADTALLSSIGAWYVANGMLADGTTCDQWRRGIIEARVPPIRIMASNAIGLTMIMVFMNLGRVPRIVLGVVHRRTRDTRMRGRAGMLLLLLLLLGRRVMLVLDRRLGRFRGKLLDGWENWFCGEVEQLGLR